MKEEIQKYILEVLVILNKRIPTERDVHSFKLGEDGRLWLWILVGDTWQSIIFDEDYEDITPVALVESIVDALKLQGYTINNRIC